MINYLFVLVTLSLVTDADFLNNSDQKSIFLTIGA